MTREHNNNRPDSTEYARDLEAVRAALQTHSETVGIRGDGLGQFVFATARGRAVEVYWGDQGIFVERWEDAEELESNITAYSTYDMATQAAAKWLSAPRTSVDGAV